MSKKPVLIIGAGITGLSCGYHIKRDYLILEKEDRPGGLCRSTKINGFTFDYTGHAIHVRDSYVNSLIKKLLGKNLMRIKRNSVIWMFNRYIPYPLQANLYYLPPKERKECLIDFVESKIDYKGEGGDFYSWCLRNYGKGISKYFMFPYNRKLWKFPLKKMGSGWCERFIPIFSFKDIFEGAFIKREKKYGYNPYFYYPISGGMGALTEKLSSGLNIRLSSKVTEINYKRKFVRLGSQKINYEYLVSTIPLPELLKLLQPEISKMKDWVEKLKWVSLLCINIGIKGKKNIHYHWCYFPEERYPFYRIGVYSNFSRDLVPDKTYTSIYVELTHEPTKKVNERKFFDSIKSNLQELGFISDVNEICLVNFLRIAHAYVIYDELRDRCVSEIIDFLKKYNIYTVGRYGSWKYSFIEEGILDGKSIAEELSKD